MEKYTINEEMEELMYTIIEHAEMEDMVDYLEMRDDVIERVAANLSNLYKNKGMDEVKKVVRRRFKGCL